MPINGAVLGAAFVAGVQPTDPLGIAAWLAIGGSWASWTMANVSALATAGDVPLIAVGAAIEGDGGYVAGPSPVLGLLLAASAGTIDPTGIAKWLIVASHYTEVFGTTATIDGGTLIAYTGPSPPGPPVGPVSGTGKVLLPEDWNFSSALEVKDEPGIQKWEAVASALKTHITSLGLITPTMQNPAVGGPVTGTGTLS